MTTSIMPMIWQNRKSLWTKVQKAGSIGVQVIPGTKTRLPTLTNGHFAVAVGRALVKDCEAKAGTTFEKMGGTARKALPEKLSKMARTFQRTPALTEAGKELYRVYRDADSGATALYSALYLEFLGDPETVYAVNGEGIGVDDPAEASWWIMPGLAAGVAPVSVVTLASASASPPGLKREYHSPWVSGSW